MDTGSALDASERTIHLPPVDPEERDKVWEHLMVVRDGLPEVTIVMSSNEAWRALDDLESNGGSGALTHAETLGLIVPVVESLFDDDVRELGLEFHAQLILMCAFPSIPESLALQVAFGRKIGEEQFRKIARFAVRAHNRGITVDEYVEDLRVADAIPHDRPVRLFRGESRRVPSCVRMQRAIALLRRTSALAPEPFRPPLLCVIAWLQWAQGRRAVAIAYLEEALRIEPASILAYGLNVTFAARLPEWMGLYRDAIRDTVEL
ncbi:hypothetical protein [Microbacterium sp. LWH12-1.2]|uniref:hypothetical protein n=1 Tax=Microbacterium sp. LWH12-1.2 TaxID=3135259 RepID=UPI00342450D6